MKKIKLVIAYDGTDFYGFQRQPDLRTVQGTLEETLSKLTGEAIEVYGAGRTDAGVHALGQVVHFTTKSGIPVEKYPYILRRLLPRDLLVISSEEVDLDFHARKSAHWKTYRYQIETSPIPNIFERRYCTHLPFPLSIEKMRKAAEHLLGTHDFTSFCSAKTVIEDRVRTIYSLEVKEKGSQVHIEVTGNGFLYNMVRIIAGTLYEIGRGERAVDEIPQILQAKDRTRAGITLPPEGLILVKVGYHPWKKEESSLS
jgi:tRNA pseudouridine38-40 synthase